MIPMLQIVQNRAVTAQGVAGDVLPADSADSSCFSLLDTGSKPDQSDDLKEQEDIAPIAIQGAIPPVSGAPLLPRPESATAISGFDSGVAQASIDTGNNSIAGGVTGADLQPGTSVDETINQVEQTAAPVDQSVATASAPTALLASGAAENALRVRWADHASKGIAKLEMAQSNQQPSNALQDVHMSAAPRPSSQPSIAVALFALTQDRDLVDPGTLPDPASEGPAFLNAPLPGSVASPTSLQSASIGVAQLPVRLVAYAATGQDSQADLALNPEELGRLRFSIQHHGDKLTVVLSAERPDTLSLLRQNAPQLLAEFAAAGFAGTTLNFGKWGGGENRSHIPTKPAEARMALADASPIPSLKGPVQGLDLRL